MWWPPVGRQTALFVVEFTRWGPLGVSPGLTLRRIGASDARRAKAKRISERARAWRARSERPEGQPRAHPERPRTLGSSARAYPVDTASRVAAWMAARMLDGSAVPVPTMSKAVPWATLVRMIGRPRVMLTARCMPSSLIGMWH